MNKKKGSWRNSVFFLAGYLIFSFFFWITDKNLTHVFAMILVGLSCYILHKIDDKNLSAKEPIKAKDIMYMSVEAILSSLSGGFPFNYFPTH